jgi:hypothetical protein
MKNLLYFICFICIGSIILFSLYSCQRPDGEEKPCVSTTENYYLTEAQKKILPYTGFDTINMVSSLGDTIHCIGTGKQSFKTYQFIPYSKPSCSNTGTEKYYEAYKIVFVDSIKNKTIEIVHYKWYKVTDFNSLYNEILISFKGYNFYIFDSGISNPNPPTYFGNIKLNDIDYSDVSKTNRNNHEDDSSSFSLINKTNGLLQIQLNPAEIWTIID